MPKSLWVLLTAGAAVLGFAFAATSTSDFTAHLDRQVHGIHCSFIPGAPVDITGTSGCHTTLMSPYSSILRTTVWGGIPVALPAMAVFAYLVCLAIYVVLSRRTKEKRATFYLMLSTLLPLCTSVVFGYLSYVELGAACKLCIGIYIASALSFIFALLAWRGASDDLGAADTWVQQEEPGTEDDELPAANRKLATASQLDRKFAGRSATSLHTPLSNAALGGLFALGCAFVLVPTAVYAMTAPDFSRYVGACGTLPHPEDQHNVLIPLGPQTRSVSVVEVFDPLCPSCRGFERRFSGLPATQEVSRKLLLFPLDDTCNWMVRGRTLHPGACTVSKAILCAEGQAQEVVDWAFAEQERIHTAATADPNAAERLVLARFPNLRACIGSAQTRYKLSQALNWAVANGLPVSTPQAYVNNTRVCEADTDLGLDYMLSRMIERARGGSR